MISIYDRFSSMGVGIIKTLLDMVTKVLEKGCLCCLYVYYLSSRSPFKPNGEEEVVS